MMVIVPRIKMRSVLLDDDVDTGAGGDGSLHFYPPLPLNHLATFVRSELRNPAKHFSATFSQTRAPFNSSLVKSGISEARSNLSMQLTFLSNKCNEEFRSNNDLLW